MGYVAHWQEDFKLFNEMNKKAGKCVEIFVVPISVH